MRGHEFINKTALQPHECTLCQVHDQAYAVLPKGEELLCPRCGANLHDHVMDELLAGDPFGVRSLVVGEDNGGHLPRLLEQQYARRYVFDCPQCESYPKAVAIRLEPVVWNANHDVYYTASTREPQA